MSSAALDAQVSPQMTQDGLVFPEVELKLGADEKKKKNECAPSEDSDQPGHLPSLIRVFIVRWMGS